MCVKCRAMADFKQSCRCIFICFSNEDVLDLNKRYFCLNMFHNGKMNVCRPYPLLEVPVNIFRPCSGYNYRSCKQQPVFCLFVCLFSISPTICQSGIFSVSFQEKETNIVFEIIRASPSGCAQPQKCQQVSGLWRI